MTKFNQLIITLFFAIIISLIFTSQSTFSNHDICNCKGYKGIGGPCYAGKGGPAYAGKGGPAYAGKGGPCYAGEGGPCYAGKGGDGRSCPLVCKCKD